MNRSLPPRAAARRALLDWYGPRRAAYPWRARRRDPYGVLVSEVMLQQTQAARVAPAYSAFMQRFPTVEALASAGRGAVIRAWRGLGYNRRAVSLFEAARQIVAEHEGKVPSDPDQLRRLPGAGPYTAAAVASIAFDIPVAAVDTNVRRLIARVFYGREADALSLHDARLVAGRWLDRRAPGAWNQALMDLGREVCRPLPRCDHCPLATHCAYRRRVSGPDARPAHGRKRQQVSTPFDGSFRQLRGRIVAALRERETVTLRTLAGLTGRPLADVAAAVKALARDGLVRASPAAVAGRPAARVTLSV
ncbi:MAG TPA: A/G-specific adenine glycosylase [Actinomycetota bacterium]|nr:A/G-specific adenine glycosylase [Actinomycetota bacterium]